MSEADEQFINDAIKSHTDSEVDDQSFCVADFSDVVNKYRYWRNKLPRVEAFYVVSCNPDLMLLRLMAAMGMRFDCASMAEIDAVLSAGALASNIIYGQPFKSNSSLLSAASVEVDLMIFDCEEELYKIKSVFPSARLVLRIQISGTAASFTTGNHYGCKMEQTANILKLGKELNLNIVGVSFHVGSLCQQPSAYSKAIGMARQLFDTAETLGYHFTLLDIGGGYPGAKGSYDIFDKLCCSINQSLEENFPEGCGVRIIAEPGCYMVCSAYTLCTKILNKKIQESETNDDGGNEKKKFYYYMNDGVYVSFAHGFDKYGFQVKPFLSQSELDVRPLVRSTLWGVSCCSSDCIVEDCLLPQMEIGEYILFRNMGAYTISLAKNFNGFAVASTKYIFPQQALSRNDQFIPFDEFCRDLGSNQLRNLLKIQDHICNGDSNENSEKDKMNKESYGPRIPH